MSKKPATITINEDFKLPSILTAEEFEAALNRLTDDALAVIEDCRGNVDDAHAEGCDYFRMNLPALTSRRRVQLYLACIARGMQLDLLDAPTSKQCVYIAQLALAAFGTQNAEPAATEVRR